MAGEDRRSLDDLLLGRTIAGKFTIESRIGAGGMGSVYRARQAGLDKIVAVKVLHRELLAEPTFASRFKREATSASRIDHPSSIRVIDFGEEPDGLLYIAMEYLEGRTLFKVLRDEAPLAPARIVDLSRQILAALAAAHELGLIHRDLKPENVIILAGKDDDGRATEHVKVCDFGIAKLQTNNDVDEKLTVEGSIVGTPEYLSPEQARGGELDARSDLYSMGVILFEMLTGQPPFRGDTPLAIVLKHLDAPPPRPSSITPMADVKLEAACLKALSKAPADRFASAREMRASLSTDTPDAAAPPATSRNSNLLVMTETPPPVSSTEVPLVLMSRRGAAIGSSARPRLSEMSEPPSSGGRAMALVIVLALLGGGGGAYWLRKRAAIHPAPTLAAAPQTVPSAAPPPPEATEPRADTPATADEPLASAGAFPPSELPVDAPIHHHHGKHIAASAESRMTGSVEPGASAPRPAYAQDLAPTPVTAVSAVSAVKVHLSNVQVKNIAAASVTAALPVGRFAGCYHGPPGSHATATVHLDMTKTGTLARCAIRDSDLAGLGACVVDATNRVVVSGIPEGGASADIQVDFDAP
jgi:serine/threonine protein kinase